MPAAERAPRAPRSPRRGGVLWTPAMDADSQAASAERALQELQQALQAATLPKGAKQDDRMRQVEDLERRALRVKNAVDSYRLEMRALSAEEQSTHKERL